MSRLALLALLLAAAQDDKPTEAAVEKLQELQRDFEGQEGFRYEAASFLAHACKADEKRTARVNTFLKSYARYARDLLFPKPPEVLRVISFANADDFYRFAGRKGISGFYDPNGKRLVNNLNDGLGTCGHEMTHALMFADWTGPRPNHWFLEGLGALLENCLRKSDGTCLGIGLSHWRFPGLRQKIEAGQHEPLRKHMKECNGLNSYVQGRWILTYLFYKGWLRAFYDEFKKSKDSSGIDALEKATGRKLDEFEKDWVEWSKGIEVEVIEIRGQFYCVLGVIGRRTDAGFRIAGVSPHSTADGAGLKEGDVISAVDGSDVRSMADILKIFKTRKEGDEVELKVNDKPVKVKLDQYIDG